MKRVFLFFMLAIPAVVVSAQDKLRLSLEDAISTALVNNYGQQILEVSRMSSTEDLAQSKRDLLPDLNASLSHGISNQSNSGDYSVSASVTLWKGGQGLNAVRRSRIALNQSDTKIAQAQNNLTINVIQAFLSVLMNEELYHYQSSVVDISEEQMKQGEIKFNSGQILESDYLLLKSQYASDKYSMTSSKINRDNAILELKTLLSIDTSEDIEVITPSDLSLSSLGLPTLQELIEQTLAWLPDIKITLQNIELANIDAKIAKGGFFPTVSLSGSVGTGYNSINNGSWGSQFTGNNVNQIGVTISIPLWNKGKTRSNVKQNDFQLRQAELEAKQTELDVRSSLEKEYLNVVSMQHKYLAAEESNNAYEETFRVFSSQFEAGSVSTTELLQQQNNYLSALNEFIQSKYSYLLNCKVLDVYMGKEIKI